MLLISDTNVLIDIEDGKLTSPLFKLPYEIAVPDVLFESELREKHGHLLQSRLIIKSLTSEFVQRAEILRTKHPRPSIMDHFALSLAMQEQCPLLTGDKDLRDAAIKENIEVHGTVWIVRELLQAKLIDQMQARNSFDSMKAKGSRLPWSDVEKLVSSFAVAGGKNE